MPYLPTAQAWLEQSKLLLSARPTTARITTKYSIKLPPSRSKKSTKAAPQPQTSKAFLTLKTYDPVSGVCLKYKTDKAAEVGRLVAALGTCGRVMAALPERGEGEGEEMVGVEAGPESQVEGKGAKAGAKEGKAGQGKGGGAGAGGGGGGGKKEKGEEISRRCDLSGRSSKDWGFWVVGDLETDTISLRFCVATDLHFSLEDTPAKRLG